MKYNHYLLLLISKVFFNNGLLTSEIQDHALNILMGNVPIKWM